MKTRTLVIGYGNPLRGDDGVGWKVASVLERIVPSEAVRILTVHQLTPELAESVGRAELVILIDASAAEKPGTWKCEEITSPSLCHGAAGHFFDARALLDFSQAIYSVTPRALLVSVGAESFAFQDHLTPAVEAVVPYVVSYICEKLVRCRNAQPAFSLSGRSGNHLPKAH